MMASIERQLDMLNLYCEGCSLAEIGRCYNLGRERIRQILLSIPEVRKLGAASYQKKIREHGVDCEEHQALLRRLENSINEIKSQSAVAQKTPFFLQLPTRVERIFKGHGIDSLESILKLNHSEILTLDGIGEGTLRSVIHQLRHRYNSKLSVGPWDSICSKCNGHVKPINGKQKSPKYKCIHCGEKLPKGWSPALVKAAKSLGCQVEQLL